MNIIKVRGGIQLLSLFAIDFNVRLFAPTIAFLIKLSKAHLCVLLQKPSFENFNGMEAKGLINLDYRKATD